MKWARAGLALSESARKVRTPTERTILVGAVGAVGIVPFHTPEARRACKESAARVGRAISEIFLHVAATGGVYWMT